MKRGRPRKGLPYAWGTLSLSGWRPRTKADRALIPDAFASSFLNKRGPKKGVQRCEDDEQLAGMARRMLADHRVTRFAAAYAVTGEARRDERGDHPASVRRLARKFKECGLADDVERMRGFTPAKMFSTEN